MGFLVADEGWNPPTPPPHLCFRNTPFVFSGANRYSTTCICDHADFFVHAVRLLISHHTSMQCKSEKLKPTHSFTIHHSA
ncbi:hypothetical protein CCUS01_12105 [Colletotrichum cuscutae]|uniref:Uncharacterized protein n=1 Tax=Colletotrichum cuscutae TaxID=1209917 RepID=A0AAI9TW06_9PEZI|nr:hypothetical protein CCUS01_12105 [Colletotrichum cuscutae]